MGWSTPKTWTSEPLTSTDMNQYIRDQQVELKDPPSDFYTPNEATDYSTTSTSWVNVDATNLAFTITTNGGDIFIHFDGFFLASGGIIFLDIDVDGARFFGDDGVQKVNTGVQGPAGFTRLIDGLAAGSHTFKLQWRMSAGTGTLYAGAGAASADLHPQMWVREIS